MIDVELLEARWRMGRIFTSDLQRLGAELVAAGYGQPAVSALAAGRSDARETFERALEELGGGRMGHAEAALVLARSFAQLVLDREAPPELVAKAIAGLRWKGGEEVDAHLLPFASLDERYERAKLLGPLGRVVAPLLDRRAHAAAQRLVDDRR